MKKKAFLLINDLMEMTIINYKADWRNIKHIVEIVKGIVKTSFYIGFGGSAIRIYFLQQNGNEHC